METRLGSEESIIGIHIRRTDKSTEVAYHPAEECVAYAEEHYRSNFPFKENARHDRQVPSICRTSQHAARLRAYRRHGVDENCTQVTDSILT